MLDQNPISEITISHTIRIAKINARMDQLVSDMQRIHQVICKSDTDADIFVASVKDKLQGLRSPNRTAKVVPLALVR